MPADRNNSTFLIPFHGTIIYAFKVVVHIIKPSYGRVLSCVIVNIIKLVLVASHPSRFLLSWNNPFSLHTANILINLFSLCIFHGCSLWLFFILTCISCALCVFHILIFTGFNLRLCNRFFFCSFSLTLVIYSFVLSTSNKWNQNKNCCTLSNCIFNQILLLKSVISKKVTTEKLW